MGDWADSILDGTMCQECGEFMGDAGDGYPVSCSSCAEEEDQDIIAQGEINSENKLGGA